METGSIRTASTGRQSGLHQPFTREMRYDKARAKAYRWGEDGIAGLCDRYQLLCFASPWPLSNNPFAKYKAPAGEHGRRNEVRTGNDGRSSLDGCGPLRWRGCRRAPGYPISEGRPAALQECGALADGWVMHIGPVWPNMTTFPSSRRIAAHAPLGSLACAQLRTRANAARTARCSDATTNFIDVQKFLPVPRDRVFCLRHDLQERGRPH